MVGKSLCVGGRVWGGRLVPEITLSISNQCNIDFAWNSSWVNKVKMHLMLREKENAFNAEGEGK